MGNSLLPNCSNCQCRQQCMECFDIESDDNFDFNGSTRSSFPDAPGVVENGELKRGSRTTEMSGPHEHISESELQMRRLREFVDQAKKGMRIEVYNEGKRYTSAYKMSADLNFVTFIFSKNLNPPMNDVIVSMRTLTEIVTPHENPNVFRDIPESVPKLELLLLVDKDQHVFLKFQTERDRDTFQEALDLIKNHGIED
eukprot:GEMP01042159.1.p1 GENE.GEMP01042159.1~~GEMP01042159.1.p1  ORF type:complete len:198 (+),score=33.27 GEMP01042159.1:70-663(+)